MQGVINSPNHRRALLGLNNPDKFQRSHRCSIMHKVQFTVFAFKLQSTTSVPHPK